MGEVDRSSTVDTSSTDAVLKLLSETSKAIKSIKEKVSAEARVSLQGNLDSRLPQWFLEHRVETAEELKDAVVPLLVKEQGLDISGEKYEVSSSVYRSLRNIFNDDAAILESASPDNIKFFRKKHVHLCYYGSKEQKGGSEFHQLVARRFAQDSRADLITIEPDDLVDLMELFPTVEPDSMPSKAPYAELLYDSSSDESISSASSDTDSSVSHTGEGSNAKSDDKNSHYVLQLLALLLSAPNHKRKQFDNATSQLTHRPLIILFPRADRMLKIDQWQILESLIKQEQDFLLVTTSNKAASRNIAKSPDRSDPHYWRNMLKMYKQNRTVLLGPIYWSQLLRPTGCYQSDGETTQKAEIVYMVPIISNAQKISFQAHQKVEDCVGHENVRALQRILRQVSAEHKCVPILQPFSVWDFLDDNYLKQHLLAHVHHNDLNSLLRGIGRCADINVIVNELLALGNRMHEFKNWESNQEEAKPILWDKYPERVQKVAEHIRREGRNLEVEGSLLSTIVKSDGMEYGWDNIIVDPEVTASLKDALNQKWSTTSYGILHQSRIRGAILYGPPGTGKTHLTRVISHEVDMVMLCVTSADIKEKHLGESEKKIRALFNLGQMLHPAIIFFDEADSLFRKRTSEDRSWERSQVNQLLQEMDGLKTDHKSPFVLISTNEPRHLDEAVLRRVPCRLYVGVPSVKQRAEIFQLYLKDEILDSSIDYSTLARMSSRFSGSDIKTASTQAAMICEQSGDFIDVDGVARRHLSRRHFELAFERSPSTVSRGSLYNLHLFAREFDQAAASKILVTEAPQAKQEQPGFAHMGTVNPSNMDEHHRVFSTSSDNNNQSGEFITEPQEIQDPGQGDDGQSYTFTTVPAKNTGFHIPTSDEAGMGIDPKYSSVPAHTHRHIETAMSNNAVMYSNVSMTRLCETCATISLSVASPHRREEYDLARGHGYDGLSVGSVIRAWSNKDCPICRLLASCVASYQVPIDESAKLFVIRRAYSFKSRGSTSPELATEEEIAQDTHGVEAIPTRLDVSVCFHAISSHLDHCEGNCDFRDCDPINIGSIVPIGDVAAWGRQTTNIFSTGDAHGTVHARAIPRLVNVTLIAEWLDFCRTEHCNSCESTLPNSKTRYTIRLIDTINKQIVVRTLMDCDFVTLSYVWGPATEPFLLQSNLKRYSDPGSLSKECVPLTIWDTVELARELGLHYLWVDSMCIVQDDPLDMQQQLPIMGEIFNRAVLVVIAAIENAHSGLPGRGQWTRNSHRPIEIVHGKSFTTGQPDLREKLETTKWNTRGWTYQEAQVARRLLVFTDTQVYWNCRSEAWCEDRATEKLSQRHTTSYGSVIGERRSFLRRGLVTDGRQFITDRVHHITPSVWEYCQAVKEFTSRDFKDTNDTLWAFAGILKNMSKKFPKGYVWAMPVEYLSHALLWESDSGCPCQYSLAVFDIHGGLKAIEVPSWSWLLKGSRAWYASPRENLICMVQWLEPIRVDQYLVWTCKTCDPFKEKRIAPLHLPMQNHLVESVNNNFAWLHFRAQTTGLYVDYAPLEPEEQDGCWIVNANISLPSGKRIADIRLHIPGFEFSRMHGIQSFVLLSWEPSGTDTWEPSGTGRTALLSPSVENDDIRFGISNDLQNPAEPQYHIMLIDCDDDKDKRVASRVGWTTISQSLWEECNVVEKEIVLR